MDPGTMSSKYGNRGYHVLCAHYVLYRFSAYTDQGIKNLTIAEANTLAVRTRFPSEASRCISLNLAFSLVLPGYKP